MKALVTGGAGFLGRAIVARLLARGDAVAVLARRPAPELAARGVEVIQADLADRDATMAACRGRDAVFHAAARAGVWGPAADYRRSNVDGTRHVLDGCRAHGVGRLVYTSSPSVTFDGRDAVGADESLPYAARFPNAYTATKAEAERMVLAASGRDGLCATALRPHLIWGPGDPHLVPRVVRAARTGNLVRVGDGRNRVDITYVDNAAEAHLLAADRLAPGAPSSGRAYFVSQGEPVVLWDWIGSLLRRLGLPPVRRSVPLRAAIAMGAVLEGAHRLLGRPGEPRLTAFSAAQLGTTHFYDISAARRDLGYAPTVSTEEGLERLVAWLRDEGAGA